MAALGSWLALSFPLFIIRKKSIDIVLYLVLAPPSAGVLAFIVISPAVIISVGALAFAGL